MEKISTPLGAWLPRATNLLTLAVVVTATWWSGAQRPLAAPVLASSAPMASGAGDTAAQQANGPFTAGRADSNANAQTSQPAIWWPLESAILPRDGLHIVGYRPAQR